MTTLVKMWQHKLIIFIPTADRRRANACQTEAPAPSPSQRTNHDDVSKDPMTRHLFKKFRLLWKIFGQKVALPIGNSLVVNSRHESCWCYQALNGRDHGQSAWTFITNPPGRLAFHPTTHGLQTLLRHIDNGDEQTNKQTVKRQHSGQHNCVVKSKAIKFSNCFFTFSPKQTIERLSPEVEANWFTLSFWP